MDTAQAPGQPRTRRARAVDGLVASALAALITGLGLAGPDSQVGADARYTSVNAETILLHGDARLTRYFPPQPLSYHVVVLADGEVVSLYPLGSPLLVLPWAAALRACGRGIVRDDGTLDLARDNRQQPLLASLLMALAGALIHAAARRRGLGTLPAAGIAATAVLGTTMFSIGAQALWPDTLGATALTGALALMLWSGGGPRDDGAGRWRDMTGPLLAAAGVGVLLALAVFAKPTYLLTALPLLALLSWETARAGTRRGWTGAATSVAAFATTGIVGWAAIRRLLPVEVQPYYTLASQLSTGGAAGALAGVLASPSRGLVWFCPWVVPLTALAVARARRVAVPARLAALAAAIVAQVALLASWHTWWGGYGYGPRLLLGTMPLWAFVAIEVMAAAPLRRVALVALAATSAVAIGIHLRGGLDARTWAWNSLMDRDPALLWEWRYPQMLAGWIEPPLPAAMPPLAEGDVPVDDRAHPAMFRRGWSLWEGAHRWTDGRVAPVAMGRLPAGTRAVSVRAVPFLVPGRVASQRVIVRWNGREIGRGTHAAMIEETFVLPAGDLVRELNILEFELPDAVSPASLGLSPDPRRVGLALLSLRLD